MRRLLTTAAMIAALGAPALVAPAPSVASTATAVNGWGAGAGRADDLSHGGGCRKSSPPGQCCHMDNSTGFVHCH